MAQASVPAGYQSYNGVTVDVGPDIGTVIEHDTSKAACDQYQGDLDSYLQNNAGFLDTLSDDRPSPATPSPRDQYVLDNFVATYDRTTKLKCGKYYYFYGTFDTTGPPRALTDWMARYFSDYLGEGQSYFGQYADPNPVATVAASSYNPAVPSQQLPVGMAASSGEFGNGIPVYSFTCAACHFKQMDDGNFAVGIGNTDYDYARQTALQGQLPYMFMFQKPDLITPELDLSWLAYFDVIPQIQDELNAPIAAARQIPGAIDEFLAFNELMNAATTQEQRDALAKPLNQQRLDMATWTGVMDFTTPPMQDDGVWNVTRILNVNEMVLDPSVQKQHGFKYHAGLGWTGGSFDEVSFIRSVISLSPSNAADPASRPEFRYWVKEYRYFPIVEYIRTFREPAVPASVNQDHAMAKRGEALFDKHCSSCHNGPLGETGRPYAHGELNVESTHANIYGTYWDPTALDGQGGWETSIAFIAANFPVGETGIYTRKVKSPRFISLWDNNRLLHNGSVWGLEELLTCRPDRVNHSSIAAEQLWNTGHNMGCNLSAGKKADLITFLENFHSLRDAGNRYNGQFLGDCVANGSGSVRSEMRIGNGTRLDIHNLYFSDANCATLDHNRVANPALVAAYDMTAGAEFENSRGFLSHNVSFVDMDDGATSGSIALEDGELALSLSTAANDQDPALTGHWVKQLTDYPGLNGLWLADECELGSKRRLIAIQDGIRTDKYVHYSWFTCGGQVSSVSNVGSWTFDDPVWNSTDLDLTQYEMKAVMSPIGLGLPFISYLDKRGDKLSEAPDNLVRARDAALGKHYTRIRDMYRGQ
ncbi:hypothetical protein [Microbulbifer sp. SA54]|uniref:hypothetical protein n=1 Tax=Microbulbifer sp. SA54 TaxID=3401577 RepID=UPI003AAABC79